MTRSMMCTLPSSTNHQAVSVGRRSLSARAQFRAPMAVFPSTARSAEAECEPLPLD